MNKTGLTVILLISAVVVLYPQITTLIDVLNLLAQQSMIPQAALEARDNALLYVSGFVLLYVFLYLFLNFKFEKQGSQQVTLSPANNSVQQIKQTPALSKNAKTWICLVSMLVFIGTYLWQFIPSVNEGLYTPIGSALISLPVSIVAACIVWVAMYFLFKYVIEI